MARSGARRVTGPLAEWTGRTDDELRLALTVAAVAGGLLAVLRFIDYVAGLGVFRNRLRAE
jgi:hypothetical protein